MSASILRRHRRPALLAAAAVGVSTVTVLSAAVPAIPGGGVLPRAAKEFLGNVQGIDQAGGAGAESGEVKAALAQFNDARNAPGFAVAGGYTAAVDHIHDMATSGDGTWQEVTNVPYDSDDIRYRDYFANTTAGVGFVTGRAQALAVGDGYLFAGGAVGGLYRYDLTAPSPAWELISQAVPALSSGALAYRDGTLWYATGDGATGSTTYTGDGVWVSANPTDSTPAWTHLADGVDPDSGDTRENVFDGAVIQQFRFSDDGRWVYVPTSYGVWRHSTTDLSPDSTWEPVFVPMPDSLPGDTADGTKGPDNYTTDVAIDPNDPTHVVAAYGWVTGGSGNGWYDGHLDGDTWTWTKSNVKGAINPKDIGRTTFAWADYGNSGLLYALVHNPDHASTGVSYSELGGIFLSSHGLAGPWSKIADSVELQHSGSALDPIFRGAGPYNGGYQPGVQAWYNQFLTVDPGDPKHVFVGLEEVYETKDSGAHWNTVGPYWNFYFSCWDQDNVDDPRLGCPLTTHPDQHAAVIDAAGNLFVGNDGGVYTRPVDGDVDSSGHGTDWTSLTDTTTPDFLQYYSVGVGAIDTDKTGFMGDRSYDSSGVIVSGGLQDVGGSILLSGESTMGSNFGGDGGDVLVDPSDGCRIVQEYVQLSMEVTNVCAAAGPELDAFLDLDQAHTRDIAPPDTLARFIAPFAADHQDINTWVAGGQHIWLNTKGFNIASGDDWANLVTLGTNTQVSAYRTATAVASDGGDAIVAFCGSCNGGSAFESGYAFGRADAAALDDTSTNHGWTIVTTGGHAELPNRYIAGADVYHDGDAVHYLLAVNGFSRKWVEGPGAGVGHLFESTDGETWTDLSDGSDAAHSLPDVPASTVKALADGRIVLGTDLGAFVRDTHGDWYQLGDGLPASVVTDLEPAPGGYLYAATYGRGIWRLQMSGLPTYDGGTDCQDDLDNGVTPADSTCPGYGEPAAGDPPADNTPGNGKGKGKGPEARPRTPDRAGRPPARAAGAAAASRTGLDRRAPAATAAGALRVPGVAGQK